MTKEAKWSKGPWSLKKHPVNDIAFIQGEEEPVARVSGTANMHLLMAAPEMAEALERLLETIAPTPIMAEVNNDLEGQSVFNVRFADIATARSALAKAFGERQ